MKKTIIIIIAVLFIAVIAANLRPQNNPPNTPAPVDNPAGIIHVDAMKEKAIDLAKIKSIELYDLEGNLIKTFSQAEVKDIATKYNDSLIDDTAFIEIITGNRMVITFNDSTAINITSYGSDTHVVAAGENISYHLISPELAKLLLEKK